MTMFYYWIPKVQAPVKRKDIDAAHLAYAIDGTFTGRGCSEGPDGDRGSVVCSGDNKDGRLGVYLEKQQWRQIPGSSVWCGRYQQSHITPDDLARKEQITGIWIDDDLGNRWLAPIARRYEDVDGELFWNYNLPRTLELDESGQWIAGGVKAKYRRLWDMVTACEDALLQGNDLDNVDEVAIAALQVNYRVSAIELAMLGIYDDEFRQRVLRVLMDLDTWLEWLKKKTADMGTDGESS